mmetsp:Transcript_1590/g.2387  ORF Transcript_1590/g.2387 Transcript_1590/m.2387 type:complete len:84 (+) Transcript_1590:75-326(+)
MDQGCVVWRKRAVSFIEQHTNFGTAKDDAIGALRCKIGGDVDIALAASVSRGAMDQFIKNDAVNVGALTFTWDNRRQVMRLQP